MPPFDIAVPWKKRHVVDGGNPATCSVNVSAVALASPLNVSEAPVGLAELAQPLPSTVLPHGQGEPLSPSQKPVTKPPVAPSHKPPIASNALFGEKYAHVPK
jgi:hypothetical protein